MVQPQLIFKREKKNPMLGRIQYLVHLKHEESSSPSRGEVKKMIAKEKKISDEKLIIVSDLQAKFGGNFTTCHVNVYKSMDCLKLAEHDYMKVRHGLMEKKVKLPRRDKKIKKNKLKKVKGFKAKAAIRDT
eukprot:GAHX01000280.1.p1 GENE.GAHX01000280.1~~GAHX01000280.1.p1  ORF type:complete len:131 (+),score=33.41 GAHX01000280.1:52-444(+)